MIWFKLPWRITLASVVCAALTSLFVNPTPAQERSNRSAVQIQQPASKQPPRRQQAAASRFVLPPLVDRDAPGHREGAASRGTCPAIDTRLTALVPAIGPTSNRGGENEKSVWSLTTSARPVFWFYVPYSTSSVRSAEFVLQDEEDNDVYSTPVKLPDRPGVVSLRLPSTSQPLETGKMYHWFFKVSCTPQNTSSPVFVEGWVERAIPNPTLARQLAVATPQQRVAVYAANGIWQDALTTVGELRLSEPANTALKADWNNLLQSIGLANIAAEPIVPCCTPNQ